MKNICFALLLSQFANEEAAPPKHIQDLLKNRILYQIKQESPDLALFFDDPSCSTVASYEYVNEAFHIQANDKSIDLTLAYNDILEGKKLELSQISNAIRVKENIVEAGLGTSNNKNLNSSLMRTDSSSTFKKWLPWIIGAVALSAGGIAIFSSMNRSTQDSGTYRRLR